MDQIVDQQPRDPAAAIRREVIETANNARRLILQGVAIATEDLDDDETVMALRLTIEALECRLASYERSVDTHVLDDSHRDAPTAPVR